MSQVIETPVLETKAKTRNFFVRQVREQRVGVVGGVIVLILLLGGIFADVLAPYEMNEVNVLSRLASPSAKYLLGADQIGSDIRNNRSPFGILWR